MRSQRAASVADAGRRSAASASCWRPTATATRSATSPPAATRPSSSPRPAKAAVTYRVVGRRQPGQRQPGRRPDALGPGHRALAARRPATYAWSPGGDGRQRGGRRPPTTAPGCGVLEIGDEAIVHVARLLPRRAARCARCGRRSTGCSAPATPPGSAATQTPTPRSWAELVALADALARHGETERGFSMALGRLGDPRTATACWSRRYDADGRAARAAVASSRGAAPGSRST